ncbi:MAG: AMP-binding protein [Pseudomonadota bacterium]|nr:AMP-binding protein [Pseudomonadota bacterium]
MDPIWLNHYPPGVPKDCTVDPNEELIQVFEGAVAEWSDRSAFSNFGQSLSFADVDRLSRLFASYLQNDLGIKPGDRVALMMPNILQYPIALFGCIRANAVVVNVNPLYTAPELKHQLDDSGAVAIIIFANSAHVLSEIIDDVGLKHVLITEVGDLFSFPKRLAVNFFLKYIKRQIDTYHLPKALSFRDILSADINLYSRPKNLKASDLAILQYTGGTTGLSKGAMLSHGSLLANVRQVNSWINRDDIPGQEIMITALPLYHIYALTFNCFAFFFKGGLNVLITNPRDTAGMVKEISRWPFTAITGVNTLFQSLINFPDFQQLDFSNLKVVSAGGMAVQEFTAKEWSRITGTQLVEGYGLSEASPVLTSNPVTLEKYNGFIGLPLPGTNISIRDDEGKELPIGEPGELYAAGPQIMLGYWNNPEATKKTITEDGFLATGDMAICNQEGYFKIVDRKKDMIIVSGFNVYPNEIENVATQHAEILEAAAIGIKDSKGNEAVKLFTVKKIDSVLAPNDVIEFCRKSLAAYKVPDSVEFIDEIPKTNVGKILRRELREM